MKRLCVMFLALCGLALPLAAADAPDTPPFSEIHSTYLERDVATHTRLLRGALREARRLLPEACAQRQRDLINVARLLGFDGLESLWLIYQDCAAQGTGPELRARRLDNARLLQETLHYAAPPAPQLALRVSHWNSVLERGVRGDAVRTVLQGFVAADPAKAQGWNLRNLLRTAQVSSALCAIAPRQNQFGQKALAELLRQGQCATGAVGPSEICAELMRRSGGDGTVTIPGASEEENKRLADLCNNLAGGASAVDGGMDLLDGFSSDECAGEADETYLYETEEIAQLTQDCFLSGGEGNPLALGPADVGIVRNRHIRWENAGTYNDFITIGEGKEGDHFHGVGNSAEEASENLTKQLEAGGATVEEDGTITRENEWVDENGDEVQERTTIRPDGTVETETNRSSPDGGSSSARETQNPDGTSSRDTVIQNADGSFTVEHSETDKDGKTTRSGKQYNAEGRETGSWEGTSGPPESSVDENGFDPNNPACQELASLTVIPGSNRSSFLDQMFERGRPVDPRKIYPSPDSAGQDEEPICGLPEVGNNSPAKCNIPVLCEEGSQLDDNCRCSQFTGGTLARQGCITANCPLGTQPIPVGMNGCFCASDEEPEDDPPPIPDVTSLAIRAFSELVWQRGDGSLFVTEDMAGEMPIEPPN